MTINDTAPTSDRYNLFICEIRPQTTPDTTLPTVSITAPANNATVSGASVAVSATAADNVSVAGVLFKLDGADLGTEDTTSPLLDRLEHHRPGQRHAHADRHRARFLRQHGDRQPRERHRQQHRRHTPPTVSVTAPANGSTVSGTVVTVSANASDNVGVASVQFLLDGAPLGAPDTTAPYSTTWNTTSATNTAHTLSARALDTANNPATSAPVSVTGVEHGLNAADD